MEAIKTKKPLIVCAIIFVILSITGVFYFMDSSMIGHEIDSYRDVAVCYNGVLYTQSHGKNHSDDGYYYGQKWQCVEYVKRFYYLAMGHRMPETMGHAVSFFSQETAHGALNEQRGMYQYINGGDIAPQSDDLLVFTDTRYGHVAIITEVTENDIEVIQQNVYGKTRDRYPLVIKNGCYYIGDDRAPAGWLRIP